MCGCAADGNLPIRSWAPRHFGRGPVSAGALIRQGAQKGGGSFGAGGGSGRGGGREKIGPCSVWVVVGGASGYSSGLGSGGLGSGLGSSVVIGWGWVW